MGRTSRRVTAGLLSGLGGGLVQKAVMERQQALAEYQEGRADARQAAADERRANADAAADERRKGLLHGIQISEDDDILGFTQGGEVIDYGVKARPRIGDLRAAAESGGLSAADKRLLDELEQAYLIGEGTDDERVDYPSLIKALQDGNRNDLAGWLEGKLTQQDAAGGGGMDFGSQAYREAKRQAEAWAGNEAGWFSTDKTDFAEYGGNRTAAIQAKTEELYRKATGQGVSAGGSAGATNKAGMPAGSGTQDDPYQVKTQADFDALKVGAIFVMDGKVYEKQ